MKRISSLLLLSLSLLMGCRTADSKGFINPLKRVSKNSSETMDDEEIRENSLRFVENVKKQAAKQSEDAQRSVQQGQQEVVSWYQDQDDRHIGAAKKHFRNSLQIQSSKNVDAHHGLAVVADLEENFREAERQYQLALAQSPSDSKLLGNLGYSYLLQNRLKDSERYLSRATQVDPANQDAVKHLGDVYAKQGRLGEAQETYSKIMNPEEARQLVANQTPPIPINEEQSFLGKLLPGRNRDESSALKAEIEQLRKLQSEQEQSLAHNTHRPDDSYNQSFSQRQIGISSEQLLKQRLAAIDQERYQNSNGRPVLINSESGEVQQSPNGTPRPGFGTQQNSQHYVRQNQPAMMNGEPSSHRRQIGSEVQYPQPARLPENGLPKIYPMTPDTQGVYNEQAQRPPLEQTQFSQPRNRQQQRPTGRPAQQSLGDDPLRKPWTGLQSGSETQNFNRFKQNESATRPPQQFLQQLRYETPAPTSAQPAQQQLRSNSQDQNAFQNASMEAARLGMGLGPGTMFSTINQTAPRQQSGANSTWNGNSFSQPNRMLPTNLPPQDLRKAYRQPVVNSMGQQVPGSQVSNSQAQFGTASRFDSRQSGNRPPTSAQYDQMQQRSQQLEMERQLAVQRSQANQQLNSNMQQAWNQRRMNLHTPSSGVPAILPPAEYGGMVPTYDSGRRGTSARTNFRKNQPQSVNRPQYPARNDSSNEQYQGQNRQPHSEQHQHHPQNQFNRNPVSQGVVVPAPYRTTDQNYRQNNLSANDGVIQGGYIQRSTRPAPAAAYGSQDPRIQPSTGFPAIVPGTR